MDIPDLKLKFVIIEDDEIDRAVIETEAAKFSFLDKIASCSHPLEAIEIITHFSPDIIFLDIEMPVMTGIELMRKKITTDALPVFITSHPEFALESYRLRDFYQMRTKAFTFDTEQDTDFIIIKQGYDKYKIPIHDILYLEAMRDYTRITTVTKQYLVLTTLNGITEKLPSDVFVRIHRSYVVNRNKVDAIQKNKIKIQSQELPIGKLYKDISKNLLSI